MKQTVRYGMSTLAAIALVATIGLSSSPARTETPAAAPEMSAEQKEMMAKHAATTSPGKHHKQLGFFVGEWDTTTKIWMGGPGTTPAVSTGHSSVNWILDGRYIFEQHKGSMMGQPYEGTGMYGYDNYKNLYTGVWVNNVDTQMVHMAGSRNPKTGVWTYYGEMDEPMIGVTGRLVKYETKHISKDKHVFTIYDLHVGPDHKAVEVTYTRKPKAR